MTKTDISAKRNEDLVRMLCLLNYLEQEDRPQEELARLLKTEERQIEREILLLQNAGFPIVKDTPSNKWRLVSNYRVPKIDFSHTEILSLILLFRKYGTKIKEPVFSSIINAILKLASLLSPDFLNLVIKTSQFHFLDDPSDIKEKIPVNSEDLLDPESANDFGQLNPGSPLALDLNLDLEDNEENEMEDQEDKEVKENFRKFSENDSETDSVFNTKPKSFFINNPFANDNFNFNFNFKSRSESLTDPMNVLLKSIEENRTIQIIYKSPLDPVSIQTIVYPYMLFYARSWYLIGYSSLYHEIRTFKVNRIETCTLGKESFQLPPNFSLEKYFGNAWNMIRKEGEDYDVIIQFSKKVAQNVSEIKWHKTQENRFLPDGRVELRFHVSGLDEILWWILGYGAEAKVIQPEELQLKIKDHIQRMKEIYIEKQPPLNP